MFESLYILWCDFSALQYGQFSGFLNLCQFGSYLQSILPHLAQLHEAPNLSGDLLSQIMTMGMVMMVMMI